jgi:hypothetical protein
VCGFFSCVAHVFRLLFITVTPFLKNRGVHAASTKAKVRTQHHIMMLLFYRTFCPDLLQSDLTFFSIVAGLV